MERPTKAYRQQQFDSKSLQAVSTNYFNVYGEKSQFLNAIFVLIRRSPLDYDEHYLFFAHFF